MDIFYTIVLSIATIILILILTYIGVTTVYYKGKISYPPKALTCPDTWNVVPTDTSACTIPNAGSPNVGKLYDSAGKLIATSSTTYGLDTTNNYINFSDPGWTKGGLSAQCNQKAWANQMGIQWDGVSNYNQC
jgi:hypothetical protein